MAFQLNIRHNIENAQTVFGRGTVKSFEQESVTVGRDPQCGCRIDAEEFSPEHFRLEFGPQTHGARVLPCGEAPFFVNDEPVTGARELLSGDEIRVGHWTLRFQKVYPRAGRARHTSVLATVAKVLVGVILVSEVFVVFWLPQKMRHIALWQNDIAKQRTALLLDDLRYRNRKATPKSELERAARESIQQELDARARYLRQYQDVLNADQRESMYEDLQRLADILDRLDAGQEVRPIPPIEIDKGIRAILNKTKKK